MACKCDDRKTNRAFKKISNKILQTKNKYISYYNPKLYAIIGELQIRNKIHYDLVVKFVAVKVNFSF